MNFDSTIFYSHAELFLKTTQNMYGPVLSFTAWTCYLHFRGGHFGFSGAGGILLLLHLIRALAEKAAGCFVLCRVSMLFSPFSVSLGTNCSIFASLEMPWPLLLSDSWP